MIKLNRGRAATALVGILAALLGFGAGAWLHGSITPGYLSQVVPILVAAIPALAAYVKTGRVEARAEEIVNSVEQVRAQTNGATSNLLDVTGRAVDALAAIAADPQARQRAAGFIRAIEAALPDQPHPPTNAPIPSATVLPDPDGHAQ